MRIIFYGTPDIAVPYLELAAAHHEIVAVITQPDRPAGRGLESKKSPVKKRALELGLPVFQPERPSQIVSILKDFQADLGIVIAYGRILKQDILEIPRHGHINVHFSILPNYRGASPVAWALVQGETKTGVSIFWLDAGMDTGPLILTKETEIPPDEDASSLTDRLKLLGVEALKEALSQISMGEMIRIPQTGKPSFAPILRKENGSINFEKTAQEIHNQVRGLILWPRAYFILNTPQGEKRVLILKTERGDPTGRAFPAPWGTILRVEQTRGFLLQCGQGSSLWITRVQPEGKSSMAAADFLNGQRLDVGRGLPLKRGE